MSKEIEATLEAMLEVLSSEEKWTKEHDARSAAGTGVDPLGKLAVRWCLRGAAICATASNSRTLYAQRQMDTYSATMRYLAQCLPNESGFYPTEESVIRYNDRLHTTFEDVRLLIKSALHSLQATTEQGEGGYED